MVRLASILFSIFVAVPALAAPPSASRADLAATAEEIAYLTRWATFAGAAYCELPSWNCGKNCDGPNNRTILLKQFDTEFEFSTEGFIAVNEDFQSIIVSYRGTSDLGSIITDAQFYFRDYPFVSGAKVHTGFYGGYLASKPIITPFLTEALKKYPNYDLQFVGHSLGGSIALLAAADFAATLKLPNGKIKVTTYGQPRVGNEKFVQYVKTLGLDIRRVVHTRDIVPHLPPRFLHYQHNGIEYWIRPFLFGGGIVKCLDADEDSNCSNSAVPFVGLLSHVSYLGVVFLLSCFVS